MRTKLTKRPALLTAPRLALRGLVLFLLGLLLPMGAVAQTIVIVKDALPDDSQDFSFSGDLGDFELDNDGDPTLPNQETFVQLAPGTYQVVENPVEGWRLTLLSCLDETENTTADVDTGTATIVLDGTETVTCTFTNTQLGKIIVDKQTLPVGSATRFDFSLDVVEGPTVATFSLADQDPPFEISVLPGFYAVFESVLMGWELLNDPGECIGGQLADEGGQSVYEGGQFADDINLSAGDEITCTFVNRTTLESNLGFTKVFSPDVIGPGSTSTLIFTITNPDGIPAGLLTFSDDLPAGMTVADFPNTSSSCGGTVDAPAGGTRIEFSGGSVGNFQNCTASVDVTSSTVGVSTNTSNELTSTDGIAIDDGPVLAIDDLTVATNRPGFSKSFAPATVLLGGRSTLTFTVDNGANPSVASSLLFQDTLPAGMVVADPSNASSNCVSGVFTGGVLTAVPGTALISLGSGGGVNVAAVGAGSTCTVSVDVVASGVGTLGNASGDLSAVIGMTSVLSGGANATLEVTADELHLAKQFADDPVPPGGLVTLEFTINNFSRDEAATAVAFTDDLTTLVPLLVGLTFDSVLFNDCGGTVSGIGTTTVDLSGATLAPESSCTLSVRLAVPPGASPGAYTNTTSPVTATIGGEMVTGSAASSDLFVSPVPILTKEFRDATTDAPDPVINAGDDVVLRFIVENTSTSSTATDVAFIDELTDGSSSSPPDTTSGFLPFPVSVVLPPNPVCGGSLALVSVGTDRQGLSLIGGSLEPNDGMAGGPDTCSFDVTVTVPAGFAPGVYLNTTEEPTATVDGGTRVGQPASDTLTVIAAPQLTKAFIDDPVPPGSPVTLEFTLEYPPDQAADAIGINFTDDLAAMAISGLTANLPPTPDPPCGAGSSLTGSAGDTFLTFTGASLMPGESCTFGVSLAVPAGAPLGSYTNTTSSVSATVGRLATTSPAADDVLDIQTLVFAKEFVGDPVFAGETLPLRFTFENQHPTLDATSITFTDNLSLVLPSVPDLTMTLPPSVDTCGGTLSSIGIFLTYAGGSLTSGSTCMIELDVTVPSGVADGDYGNTTGSVTAIFGGSLVVIDPATDFLTVDANRLSLLKEFADDPVAPGDPVTLEFTLENLDSANGASEVGFIDDLGLALSNLTFDSVLFDDCGGTVAGTGTDMITVSGVSLAATGSCTVRVSLTVPGDAGAGIYTNTTSEVTGMMMSDFPVTGDPASADLTVLNLLDFSKSFDGPSTATGTAVLTFTITNPGTVTVGGLAFSDDLDSVIPGLVATGLPLADVCGNGSQLSVSGASLLTLSGGEVPPSGGMCSFDVDVVVPTNASAGTFPNTTSALSANGLQVAEPATADLVIEPPPTLAKSFTPATTGVGVASTLTLTIDNSASALDASDLAFTDSLPAGMEVASPPSASTTCSGGALTAVAGSAVVSYTGGTVGAATTCTVVVDVTASVTGDLVNVTGDLTSSSGNSGAAQATLTIVPAPTFSKAFTPDFIGLGGVSVLTFTIDNSANTVAASSLDFTDNLPVSITVATPSNAATSCTGGTLTAASGSGVVSYSGGAAAAGATCTVSVDVLAGAAGVYVNTSEELTSSLGSSGTATATLNVNELTFSKQFTPDTIGPGSTTQLRFDIGNTSASALAEDVAFTDVLPAGVVIATPSSASSDCTDGVLSAPDGGATISLSGARVGASVSCAVTVNVTAAAAGTYDNLSGDLTSSLGNAGPAAATLTVSFGSPGFSKSFTPAVIPPGGVSTLTFTITNGDEVVRTPLSFTDTLPSGLVVATPSNASSSCGGVLTANPGASVITVTSGAVAGGDTCTVSVDATAADAGLYVNVSGELIFGQEGSSSGFATAVLDVFVGFLVKSFTDDPVAPGSAVTLEFMINNPSRIFPASDITFSDDLDAALSGMVATGLPIAACGGTLSTADGGVTIDFIGGDLPPEGSCTFSLTLQLPPVTDGTFTNTTSTITATIDGKTQIGDPASDQLKVVAAPVLVKEFLDAVTLAPDPVVGAGDDIVIRFTVTNTSTVSAASGIGFDDELTTFLPFPVAAVLPAGGFCGPGASLSLTSPSFETHILSMIGGSLAPSASCSFEVTLSLPTGLATGTYTNTTDVITALVADEMVSGMPASDSFDLVAAPRLTKEFTDDPVQPGGTVTLEFTLEHDGLAPGDAVDVEFTDDLAALVPAIPGLVATGLPLTDLCGPGNGSLVGTAGNTLLTFSAASLTPGQICTFSVSLSVPGTADAGAHSNTTSNVVATVLGVATTENPASNDLMIGGLVLSKEFIDDPVIAGGTVTLEFVITNQSPDPVTDISFFDVLDPDVLASLMVVDPLPLVDPCGTGSLLDVSGPGTTLVLSGGSLEPAGPVEGEGTCSFSVSLGVPAATPSGTYTNRTSGFTATFGGERATFPDAQDDLVVANEQLLLTKEFIDDPVVPGGTVTLEFGISTLGSFEEVTDLAFTDDLGAALAGLTATGLPKTVCGGTLSSPDGGMTLGFSGGSFNTGDCGFSVTVEVPAAVPFGTTITNTTSAITGTIGDAPVTGEPASDDLMIDYFTFIKYFDGLTKPTGTPLLTFMITNLSTVDTITDLGFTDDLDAVIPGLAATSLPAEPCGVGSSISGASFLTMSGGSLLPGGSCTFSVELAVPASSGGGTFLNTTSELEVFGASVASPATATLEVEPPPLFGKTFLPDFTVPGGRSALTFLIDNSVGSFQVTDLSFVDHLPAGLVVAPSADVGTNCTGGVLTAVEGSDVIDFTGGELLPGEFCLIQVDVTGTTPGTYVNTSSKPVSSSGESAAAIDTLIIVGSGEPCPAPDGENLRVDGETILDEREFVVCDTITVGPNVGVIGPDGHLVLRAGVAVVIEEIVVGPDGSLTVSIEPVLIP